MAIRKEVEGIFVRMLSGVLHLEKVKGSHNNVIKPIRLKLE